MNEKISVIIPLYNKEKYIAETVQSVLQQSFSDFELLIVDDGSTDESIKIVRQISDSRIKILQKTNGGVSDARNFGVQNAIANWIFLLDADDIIYENCLDTLYGLTKKYPNEYIYVGNFNMKSVLFCTERNEGTYSGNSRNIFYNRIFTRTGNTLIKKSLFYEVGFYNTRMTFYEDMEHILRYADRYTFVYTPISVMKYRISDNSLSKTYRPLNREFAYYADFKHRSFYAKLIIGEIIYRSYLYHSKNKYSDNTKYLFIKYLKHLHYITIAKITRKFINFKIIKQQIFNPLSLK